MGLFKRKPEPRPEPKETREPIEPLRFREPWDFEGDAERLSEWAREGNLDAARLLVNAGEIFARAVEELFRESPESGRLFKKIAVERLSWPSVVSRRQGVRGGPASLARYLEDLNLGGNLNLNFEKQDTRTESRQQAAMFLRRMAEGLAAGDLVSEGISREEATERTKFVRDGLARDPWRKSSHGKAARAAIEKVLEWHYQDDRWLDEPIFSPIIDKVKKDRKSVGSIKTALIRESLDMIHGGLWD